MILRRAAPRRLYVSTRGGSDSNSGITASAALATIGAAATRLRGLGGGLILLDAPSSDPLATSFAYSGGVDVSILPAGNDPWHITTTGAAVTASGVGLVSLAGGIITSTSDSGVVVNVGRVAADSCEASGATNGWRVLGASTLTADDCTGHGETNDGWNINGTGTTTLTDCSAIGCGDEGASPHETATLIIKATAPGRSRFAENTESGVAAVATSRCDILGPVVIEGNGVGSFYGGAIYLDNAYGTIGELTSGDGGPIFRDNVRWGLNISGTAGTVTLGAYTSSGNGDPDDLT